jgi:hypothetical protein
MALTPREAWQHYAEPVHSTNAWENDVDRIVLHYPGADWADMDIDNDGDFDKNDTVMVLRNTQHYYLTARGYSIGYSFASDDLGSEFELRGFDYENAANVEVNETSVSHLAIVDAQNPASPKQVCAIQRSILRIRTRVGRKLMVVTHRSQSMDSTNTACPGVGLTAQLMSGAFEPPTHTTLKFGQRNAKVGYVREVLRVNGAIKGDEYSNLYDQEMVDAVKALKKFLGYRFTTGKVIGTKFWKFLDTMTVS